jgi:hypothetical protein
VEWVDGVLQEAGALRRRSWQRIRSGRASSRGCGTAPPLMLQAHVTAVLRAVATGMQPAGDIVLLDCPSFRSELEAHVA